MLFLLRFILALLLAVSLGLLLLFGLTPYADLAARIAVPNFGLEAGVAALPLSPARYAALRGGLALVASLAGAGLVAMAQGGRRGQPARRRPAGAWG